MKQHCIKNAIEINLTRTGHIPPQLWRNSLVIGRLYKEALVQGWNSPLVD